MTFQPEDWHRLKLPAFILGASFVLVGIIAYFAEDYRQQQALSVQSQQNVLNQANQKYLLSGQERETIVKYLPLYQNLLETGFIGEERRIEWVEKLREIHTKNKLFSIEYNISKQQRVSPSYLPKLDSFRLFSSTMMLHLSMLHEGDLLTLLDNLNQQSSPFIIRDCELLKPPGYKINPNQIAENIQASCQLDWFTMHEGQTRVQ